MTTERGHATAEEIAERMRKEPGAAAEHFAATVSLRHDPPSPFDGPVDRATLADAFRATGADPARTQTVESIRVVGNRIVQRSRVSDGHGADTDHVAIYEVSDGQIVSLESRYTPLPEIEAEVGEERARAAGEAAGEDARTAGG